MATMESTSPPLSSSSLYDKSIKGREGNSKNWAFPVDYNDHFETPLIAYEDVLIYLKSIAIKLSKSLDQLIVYDPYYCKGKMIQLLHSIGIKNIINRNRDFYKDMKNKTIPEYDVLVTNPPYSGEHKLRLLQYLKTSSKPSALLLPVYIATKSYWKDFVEGKQQQRDSIIYFLPASSYQYDHPEGTGKDIPPFFSCWFLCGFNNDVDEKMISARKCSLVHSVKDLILKGYVVEKRPNPKARKRMKLKHSTA